MRTIRLLGTALAAALLAISTPSFGQAGAGAGAGAGASGPGGGPSGGIPDRGTGAPPAAEPNLGTPGTAAGTGMPDCDRLTGVERTRCLSEGSASRGGPATDRHHSSGSGTNPAPQTQGDRGVGQSSRGVSKP